MKVINRSRKKLITYKYTFYVILGDPFKDTLAVVAGSNDPWDLSHEYLAYSTIAELSESGISFSSHKPVGGGVIDNRTLVEIRPSLSYKEAIEKIVFDEFLDELKKILRYNEGA